MRTSPLLGKRPSRREQTANMASIGMSVSGPKANCAPIEETLVFASIDGMEDGDLRTLSLVTQWVDEHSEVLHVERLVRCVREVDSERVRAYWSAVAQWKEADRRFAKLEKIYDGKRVTLLLTGSAFQIRRHGEDTRFEGTCLIVPAKAMRQRRGDVAGPEFVARHHLGYRNRVQFGPNFRADLWTALTLDPDASTADVARRVGCAFAAAWKAKRDYSLLFG